MPSTKSLSLAGAHRGAADRTGVDLRGRERCRQRRRARSDRNDQSRRRQSVSARISGVISKANRLAYILEDNDDAGREHTRKILAALTGIVPNIAVVPFPELPEKGDVSDWLEAGGNKKLLLARAEQALKTRRRIRK